MADKIQDFEVNSPRWLSLENFEGDPFSYRKEYKKGFQTKIYKYDLNNNLIQEYVSIKEAERDNGLSRNFIYSATYARSRTAIINGYKFSYYKLNN